MECLQGEKENENSTNAQCRKLCIKGEIKPKLILVWGGRVGNGKIEDNHKHD
jgi:hypothetical protein